MTKQHQQGELSHSKNKGYTIGIKYWFSSILRRMNGYSSSLDVNLAVRRGSLHGCYNIVALQRIQDSRKPPLQRGLCSAFH